MESGLRYSPKIEFLPQKLNFPGKIVKNLERSLPIFDKIDRFCFVISGKFADFKNRKIF